MPSRSRLSRPTLAAAALLFALAPGAAFAASAERDKAWNALVAEARKRGGEPTVYKDSQSYVFQRPDGAYLTLTSIAEKGVRAVCVISKDQNVRVCGNWDNGVLGFGWRADANSEWVHSDKPPEEDKGVFATLMEKLAGIMEMGHKTRYWPWPRYYSHY